MRGMRPAILLFLLCASLRADVGIPLTPELASGEWKPLLSALAAKGAIQASFTELRFFPFRRDPTVLKGTLRVSPEKGLSLQYIEPEASVLVADSSGILLRDSAGRNSPMPADSRQAGAIASLLPIMRFDLASLFPRFDIRADRQGENWRFEFRPRDPVAASALGTITVVGTNDDVRHLEFKRSERQRIEIEVEATRSGIVFTPAELRDFFR
jgi:Outer membrane lipoprotein carrier protein LolA-like